MKPAGCAKAADGFYRYGNGGSCMSRLDRRGLLCLAPRPPTRAVSPGCLPTATRRFPGALPQHLVRARRRRRPGHRQPGTVLLHRPEPRPGPGPDDRRARRIPAAAVLLHPAARPRRGQVPPRDPARSGTGAGPGGGAGLRGRDARHAGPAHPGGQAPLRLPEGTLVRRCRQHLLPGGQLAGQPPGRAGPRLPRFPGIPGVPDGLHVVGRLHRTGLQHQPAVPRSGGRDIQRPHQGEPGPRQPLRRRAGL